MATNFTYVLSSADYNERRDIDACFVCVEPLARSERKRGLCGDHEHLNVQPIAISAAETRGARL
jgi:hypothetical protein